MDQTKYNQLYNSLDTVYSPAKQLIQQQQAALPSQFEGERAGLEQAKKNAFRDISSKARSMGVAYGGYSPSEQARYTGATYLPAVADIGQRQSAAFTALQEALNNIGIKQTESATSMYQSQVADEASLAEEQRQFDATNATNLYKANLSASTKTPTTTEIKTSLAEDLGTLFQGYDKTTDKWYTENQVIKQLTAAYPELSAKEIRDMTYAYRKNMFGE